MGEQALEPGQRRRRRRARADALTTSMVAAGGVGVMLLIGGIFVYLLSVVAPLFAPAQLSERTTLVAHAPSAAAPVLLDIEVSGEIGFRLTADGELRFFAMDDGRSLEVRRLTLGADIRRVLRPDPESNLYALELENQRLVFVEFAFPVSFADDRRRRLIRVDRPFDGSSIDLGAYATAAPLDLSVHLDDDVLSVVLLARDGHLHLLRHTDAERGIELWPAAEHTVLGQLSKDAASGARLLMAGPQWLYVLRADRDVDVWDLRFADDARRLIRTRLPGADIARVTLLLGGSSLLVPVADSIEQWFPVRADDGNFELHRVRSFDTLAPPRALLPEARRRGFLSLNADGGLSIHHTTSERTLLRRELDVRRARAQALSARADLLLLEDAEGRLHSWRIDNEHPETSVSALFAGVWYEDYPGPTQSWQSSSASSDNEPKFGVSPLLLGTLKSAFYAMLFAVPVAIFGAIYTAYFMAPGLRSWIKPSIELMAALPTVILGFLAGLWLAPLLETHLTAFLAMLVVLPLVSLLAGTGLQLLPRRLSAAIPDGWQALVMVPVLLIGGMLALEIGPWLEQVFFGGDLRNWLRIELALDFDQRNAMVVGIAMGIAVIPVIFAIAEDAIHSVPGHLSHGALALGASRWQALVRVVLPTASPGIFSALMIGFGRAVGETMIVLMASGNTPVLGMDPFSGMRTMAANLAVELPESEVASTHYRILFLTALLLFVFTFAVNTLGEVVRQRLRDRYGHL